MHETHKMSDYCFGHSIQSRQVNSFTLSTLGALGPMKVNVIWGEGEDQRMNIDVDGSDTVAMVIQKLEAEGSIPPEQVQSLSFAGVSMDIRHNLSYYGVETDCDVTLSSLRLHVAMLTSRTITIDGLKRSDTIDTVKRKI